MPKDLYYLIRVTQDDDFNDEDNADVLKEHIESGLSMTIGDYSEKITTLLIDDGTRGKRSIFINNDPKEF